MEFSEKGTMDPMNGYFSPINGLESINGIQFSLCGTPTNLIFAHREYDSENAQRCSFQQGDVIVCIQSSILPIHKWHELFVTCVQRTWIPFSQPINCIIHLNTVLVFKKQIIHLEIFQCLTNCLCRCSAQTILEQPHISCKL